MTNFELGLGYGASYHSEEGYWHGPRASAALRFGEALTLSLSAQTALPARHDLGELELRIQALLLTLGVGFRRAFGPGAAFEARLGPGLDVVDYRPLRSALAGVELGSGATEVRPNLMAGAGVVLGRSPFRLALFAEAALSLSKTHYELADGERTRVIAEPSPFSPRLAAEARF